MTEQQTHQDGDRFEIGGDTMTRIEGRWPCSCGETHDDEQIDVDVARGDGRLITAQQSDVRPVPDARVAVEAVLDSWTKGLELDESMGSTRAQTEPLWRLIGHLRAALASAAPAVSDGEGATSEAAWCDPNNDPHQALFQEACFVIDDAGCHNPEEDDVEGQEHRSDCSADIARALLNAGFLHRHPSARPASPVVAPSATEAPQAPAEQEGRVPLFHTRGANGDALNHHRTNRAGKPIKDHRFTEDCACDPTPSGPAPSPLPDTADDEGVQ